MIRKSLFLAVVSLLFGHQIQGVVHPYIYVSNYISGNVSVIDTTTRTRLTTIPVGTQPTGGAFNIDGSQVYIPNLANGVADAGTVSVIDVASNTVVATITGFTFGPAVLGFAFTNDGRTAYISSGTSSTHNVVYVVDTVAHQITSSITVGDQPTVMVITPDGAYLYVTNLSTNTTLRLPTVSIISTTTHQVTKTLTPATSLGNNFSETITLHPSGSAVYIPIYGSGTTGLYVIDTSTQTGSIASCSLTAPHNISITPKGGQLFICNNKLTTLATANLNIVDQIYSIPNSFESLVSNKGKHLYILSVGPAPYPLSFSVMDVYSHEQIGETLNLTATGQPLQNQGLAMSLDDRYAYIVNPDQNRVAVIHATTQTLVKTIDVGSNPLAIAGPFVASSHVNPTQSSLLDAVRFYNNRPLQKGEGP
ncbi:MAG: hypothetical protein FJZ63_03230 [Chlamydiae bacterium]|nr:hypothetical protein [Chlamydiota bacterium]